MGFLGSFRAGLGDYKNDFFHLDLHLCFSFLEELDYDCCNFDSFYRVKVASYKSLLGYYLV